MKHKKPLCCDIHGGRLNEFHFSAWHHLYPEREFSWSEGCGLEIILAKELVVFKYLFDFLLVSLFFFITLSSFAPALFSVRLLRITAMSICVVLCLRVLFFLLTVLHVRLLHGQMLIHCTHYPDFGLRWCVKLFIIRFVMPISFILSAPDGVPPILLSVRNVFKGNLIIYLAWLSNPIFMRLTLFCFGFFPKPSKVPIKGKVKVLHTTCSFDWGGSQRQIMNLCSGSSLAVDNIAIEIFPKMNQMWRTDVREDPSNFTSEGMFCKALYPLFSFAPSYNYHILQIYKLFRVYSTTKPDLVVGWGHEVCIYAYVAAVLAKVPHIGFCIRTVNPCQYQNANASILRYLHSRMSQYLTITVVNSSFLKDDYSEWAKIDCSKISICMNGIEMQRRCDNKRKSLLQSLNIPSRSMVVLNVARFSPEKGQQILIQAAELLQNNRQGYNNVHWIFCGEGSTKIQIEAYVKERKIKNVHFTGAVIDPDKYMASSDIFVIPSDFEGMPNAMMEAMSLGLPCISTNQSGALDLAEDGKEALFIPPRNSEALAEKIEWFVNNPKRRREIGENAKKRIQEFSVEKMVSRFNEIITTSIL